MMLKHAVLLAILTISTTTPAFADEPGIPDEDARRASITRNSQGVSGSSASAGVPLERADGERLAEATGHFARSRSLLISAIQEFDKGFKIANPDAILDSKEWRKSLVTRAHELERVLDPQPRASKGGVRYEPDTRLLNK